MARGWESKSVESQIESARESKRTAVSGNPLNDAQVELLRKKEGLMSSRTRVLRELRETHNPRYREMLGKALAELDARLSDLENPS